jgi:AraC-like DNA-binding protein
MVKEKKKVQPEVPELQIDYSNHPDYQQCYTCKKYKPKNVYIKTLLNGYQKSCTECRRKINRDARLAELERNGGSNYIHHLPGMFHDDIQRRQTWEVLKICGYSYNDELGIWYKEPWKLKDGTFPNIRPYIRKYHAGKHITKGLIYEVFKLREDNPSWSQNKIASKLGVSNSTVSKIFRVYGKKAEN